MEKEERRKEKGTVSYLHWDEKTINDFSPENVSSLYSLGYVFTRVGKGVMHQTRSVRIDLSKFELLSENRRVLKKNDSLKLKAVFLPLGHYDFRIGKLAKDFYDEKFGPGIMSAQKIKEMLADKDKSNFNLLLSYSIDSGAAGYAVCYSNEEMLHYSYPFYDLKSAPKDTGLGMMILAIEHAKKNGLKYAYLGSLQRPSDVYKLQFTGLEWFDGGPDGTGVWSTDMEMVKKILASTSLAS